MLYWIKKKTSNKYIIIKKNYMIFVDIFIVMDLALCILVWVYRQI